MKMPSVILLKPNRVRRSYLGGRTLDELENKDICEDSYYPEDWIASGARALNDNVKEGEENAGLSEIDLNGSKILFDRFLEEYAEDALGKEHLKIYGRKNPILQKLLDSAVRLHFQVHPDISFAKEHLNSEYGKAEAYLIFGIRGEIKEPYIYLGFQRAPSREEFKRLILEQDIDGIEKLFDKIPVKRGDALFIPGGLPHAIGEGIMMLETMEPTDFTFLPEFIRDGVALSEKKRYMGLDIEKCLDAVDYNSYSVEDIRKKFMFAPKNVESNGDYCIDEVFPSTIVPFNVFRINVFNGYEELPPNIRWSVNVIAGGEGKISCDSGEFPLKRGSKFLLPVSSRGYKIEKLSQEPLEIIRTFPPGL
jgi:mannose-6-phosphate isomerase